MCYIPSDIFTLSTLKQYLCSRIISFRLNCSLWFEWQLKSRDLEIILTGNNYTSLNHLCFIVSSHHLLHSGKYCACLGTAFSFNGQNNATCENIFMLRNNAPLGNNHCQASMTRYLLLNEKSHTKTDVGRWSRCCS